MKINNVEFIKVRDAKVGETGWAYIKGDDIILDNDFKRIKRFSRLTLDDNRNIIDFKFIDEFDDEPDTRIEQLKSLVGRKVKAKAGEGEIIGADEFSIRAEVKIGDEIKHWNLPTVLDHLI
ncbi:hypothetical protein [Ligilactobacillus agilis]|uniref:hypothetical protein n=1 Tax=Ligilactobacillus agilis TaxID=1601 RepID=UPI0022E3D04B|nr:hypothetical protein [Ligilactobacillus agilis]